MSWLSQKQENFHKCRYKKFYFHWCSAGKRRFSPISFLCKKQVLIWKFHFCQCFAGKHRFGCISFYARNFALHFRSLIFHFRFHIYPCLPYFNGFFHISRDEKFPFRFHLYPPYHSSGRCPGIRIPSNSLGNNYKKVTIVGVLSFSK